MPETWTDITTQDDPGAPHKAVALGRVYRDNDDYNCRSEAFGRAWVDASGISVSLMTLGTALFSWRAVELKAL